MSRPLHPATIERSKQWSEFAVMHEYKLTPREQEVLAWSGRGKSSWEISRILACSEATVNFHFANIRRKFAVGSRSVAVLIALEKGLICLR